MYLVEMYVCVQVSIHICTWHANEFIGGGQKFPIRYFTPYFRVVLCSCSSCCLGYFVLNCVYVFWVGIFCIYMVWRAKELVCMYVSAKAFTHGFNGFSWRVEKRFSASTEGSGDQTQLGPCRSSSNC